MASTARSTSPACGLILSSRSKFPRSFAPPPFFFLFRGGGTKKAFQKHLKGYFFVSIGAEDEDRTRDNQLGRLMLYQLSYFRKRNVGEDGFEPPKS